MHLLSVSTITIALVILGFYLLCYRNFQLMAAKTNPNITGTVYLADNLSQDDVHAIQNRLMSESVVLHTNFKNKDMIVTELKTMISSTSSLFSTDASLFPEVLEIELSPNAATEQVTQLKEIIQGFKGVLEVDFSEAWMTQFKKLENFFTIVGMVLMIGVVLGCSFIIANFMSMRHHMRQNEVDVMRLFGAKQSFVMAPFLLEACIEGLLGGVFALAVLYGMKVILASAISASWTRVLGVQQWEYLNSLQIASVLAFGLLTALLSSFTVFLRLKNTGAR